MRVLVALAAQDLQRTTSSGPLTGLTAIVGVLAVLAAGHNALPVVDADDRCVGIVSRRDLLVAEADERAPVLTMANEDVVSGLRRARCSTR